MSSLADNKGDGKSDDKKSDEKEKEDGALKRYREPRESEWVNVVDDFSCVWAMNVTHAASDMHNTPFAHWADGCVDLTWVRRSGCCPVLSLFLNMEKGEHTDSEVLEYVKARAVRLVPGNVERECLMGIDGERIPMKPLDLRVFRGVLNVFCL